MADTDASPRVLVGVDGSPSSLDAVGAAAYEARLRGTGLHVVHAWTSPWPLGRSAPGSSEVLREAAQQVVADAAGHARAAEPGVDVEEEIVTGDPLTVLSDRSRGAALAVVGSRGLGGFGGLLLGSVAVRLTAHGDCPVLVVRGRRRPEGPVLLGVDGSRAGDAAVAFAFAEASARGAELVALHTWNDWTGPVSSGPGDMMPPVYDSAMLRDDEERVLSEALSGRRERYPEVRVRPRLERSFTRPALIEASAEARLVVVGARGRGGFAGLLLGSVSQAVLHHAHCPVAVVRGATAAH